MAKYFEVDFRKGSFQDQTGRRTVTVTGSPEIKRGDKGNYAITSNIKGLVYSSQVIPDGAFTIVCYTKKVIPINVSPYSGETIISSAGNNSIFSVGLNICDAAHASGVMYLGGENSRVDFVPISNNEWHCYIVTCPGSAQADIALVNVYIDGVLQSKNVYNSVPQASRATAVRVGNGYVNNNPLHTPYLATYDHVFTEAERAAAIRDFNNSYPVIREKLPQQSIINKPMDLSNLKNTGLVAAYNMIPQGNTLVDISGNGCNGTVIKCISAKSGLAFSKNGSVNISSTTSKFKINNFSVSMVVTPKTSTGNLLTFIRTGWWTTFNYCVNGLIYVITDTYKSTTLSPLPINVKSILTLTSNGTTINQYINGILTGSFTPTGGVWMVDDETRYISINTGVGSPPYFDGEIHDMRFYNRILTSDEIKAYHNSFVTPTLIEDFSSEGADGIAKVPAGWVKQSGSFKIGEWVGSKVGNLVVNGNFDIDSSWTKGTGWTIHDGKAYCNNVVATPIAQPIPFSPGHWYKIECDIVNNGTTDYCVYAGLNESTRHIQTLWLIDSQHVTIYGQAQTNTLVAGVYSGGAGFNGTVDNFTVTEIYSLPTLKNGTKYLECMSSGVLAIPSKQVYGTWEFDVYKGADVNVLAVALINNKPISYLGIIAGSYWTQLYSDEKVKLNKANLSTLIESAASYIINNTWYRMRITRTIAGVFTVMIKGGTLIPTAGYNGWTLVAAPIIDNSFTSSEYFVLSFYMGDRITNINLLDGIEQ